MKKCCISLGVNSPSPHYRPQPLFQDFSRGLKRISDDLSVTGFRGDLILWDQFYPKGCPKQVEAHGAFKPFCFYEAFIRGYDVILWLDASIKIISSLDPIFSLIERDGYIFFKESHSLGEYCKDESLESLGIDREASFSMPCCWSCVLGLDLRHERSRKFLQEWKSKAEDGITFPGPKWSGVWGWPRTASKDIRVKGHREQSIASAIALKLEMNNWKNKFFFSFFFNNDRDFVRSYKEEYV
jgi:hypothetical protein